MKKFLLLCTVLFTGMISAQITITTNHPNNNGNGLVLFHVHNTNANDIIITDVSCHLGTSANNNIQLLYNTTALLDYAAPWSFGTVGDGQNGWINAGTATISSNTANGIVTVLSGLNLTIPAGATYALALSANTLQYSSLGFSAGVNTFSSAGVELLTGDGISWGGTVAPSTPANYPRGLIGGITFIPAIPCTAPPEAGVTATTMNPVCPSVNTNLSLNGLTLGTGQTYQWQSSPDGITYTDIPGGTTHNYTANQTVATYYRAIVTCSGMPDTSTPLLINMLPFMNCYCNSIAAFAGDEEIYNVVINGDSTDQLYANSNGCNTVAPGPGSIQNRYSNFTTLPAITSIDIGQTVSFSIHQDECDGPFYYNNGIGVWIDFNQNGLFTDAGETVFIEPTVAPGPRTVSGTFNVPLTAIPGNTVMRVICAENFSSSSLTPCLTYNFGETEDHLINIACPDLTAPVANDEDICTGSNATLNAIPQQGATISWWDSPSGGTQLATSNTYTTPNLFTNATYYAQQDLVGCLSGPREQVDVLVANVDVEIVPVDASCNGLNDGSFDQTNVYCGTAPFVYSVDGGIFGPIPTNLSAGAHTVIVRDANLDSSNVYSINIGEPNAPANLNVINTTIFTAELNWTPQGSETQWIVEYGPSGFIPGTGTIDTATSSTWMLYGLSDATQYDFYVAAGCVPNSDFSSAQTFTTQNGFFAADHHCGPGFIDISATGIGLNLSDEQTANITSGFPVKYQGVVSSDLMVDNNGFISLNGQVDFNIWRQDLDAVEGNVYYQTLNVSGDSLFIVQWKDRTIVPGVVGQNISFEIIFNYGTREIFYVYDDVIAGGTQYGNDYANQAEIWVDGPLEDFYISMYDPEYLMNNSCVRLYDVFCPNITNFTSNVLQEDAMLDWDAGAYGESAWTLIYGPAGFDPTQIPSAAIDTFYLTSSDAGFAGTLTQLTSYDVYIYSECQADSITSDGFLYSFTTLPWCSNPGNIVTATGADTVYSAWSWTETDPSYPVTSFNLQYGNAGFELYTGTTTTSSGTNISDTIADPGLLSGGGYELYVQAVCGADTSAFIGPVEFTMPLTNDDACNAEVLNADGTIYTFTNLGATVAAGEDSIVPPTTGLQTTTGWGNSILNNTTWFSFTAPVSGNIRINNTAVNYNGQVAVYDATNCGVFGTYTLLGANDNAINGNSMAPEFTICGLTPGSTYYLMHDGFNSTIGYYSVSIREITVEAGNFTGMAEICSGSDLDLFTTISGNDTGGVWSSSSPVVNAAVNGSIFNSADLASQSFSFEYVISDGCASDMVISQVEVFPAPNAGMDGSIIACRNQPIDLLGGLNGTADLNGTWYDPSALAGSQITTSNTPGTYIFTYITGNGVCPDDTATVDLMVQSCDFLSLENLSIENVKVYPNPSDGTVYIEWPDETTFGYTLTDMQGKMISSSGTDIQQAKILQMDLGELRPGVYFIYLTTSSSEKTFKLVIR